jgi:hypothetical protein
MKKELLKELKIDDEKAGVDILKLNQLIQLGKPIKTFGFIHSGYDSIGLFETHNGENIFHLLAHKGVLSTVVPTIFNNANAILAREGIEIYNNAAKFFAQEGIEGIKAKQISFLKKAINALNQYELTPADLAARNNDFAGLQTLDQYGAQIIQSNAWVLGNSKYLSGLQITVDYANVIKSDNWTKTFENNSKFKIESSPIFLFMTRAITNNALLTDDFVKLFGGICTNSNISDHIKLDSLSRIIKKIRSSKQDEGRKEKLCAIIQDLLDARNKITDSAGVGIEHTTKKGGLSVLSDITEKVVNTQQAKEEREGNKTLLANNTENVDKENTVSVPSVDQKIVPKSNKPELREATIEEYAKAVKFFIENTSAKCKKHIFDELGQNYTELHSFIAIANYSNNNFKRVLEATASKMEAVVKAPLDFLAEYINKLAANDLTVLNSKTKSNAYDLACRFDDLNLIKLLLKKGVEVDVYTKNTGSLFEAPIKFHSTKILKYLLTEQKDITPDWYTVLSKAFKYAEPSAVEHYVNSNSVAIEIVANRAGKIDKEGKYTILNKALDGLVELSELERYTSQNMKDKAIGKIFKLCECLKIIIAKEKIYYSTHEKVLSKTLSLLREINKINAAEITDCIKEIKYLVVSDCKKLDIAEIFLQKIEQIENGDDNNLSMSDGTQISRFSALSDMGYENYKIIGNDSFSNTTTDQ